MNRYLKCYRVTLRTLAPVFTGSGKEIGKKEYFFQEQDKIAIPDIQRLYGQICQMGKGDAFEAYLLGKQNTDLTTWLQEQDISVEDIMPCVAYTLDYMDVAMEKDARRMQVMECIKDPYGNPYIPGSSIKGMLRTILLGAEIAEKPQRYQESKRNLKRNLEQRASRTAYLKKEIAGIEGVAYRTLAREKTKPWDAVNDVMQGLIVSDSEPLSTESLALCQKVDVDTQGTEKRLPLLRECVKPDTEIHFTITIDSQLCPYTEERILSAVKVFMKRYNENFLSAFTGMEKPTERDVFLGGGCGFASKTVIYPLYGKREGVDVIMKIFDQTKVPRLHKHDLDKQFGVSPHTVKCTSYQGKLYQMGLCRIEKTELL